MVLDGKSSQEYPVNAEIPQGSILGPTLMMLSVILLSMLMILLFILSVIRHLICGNNLNWLLNLNLIYETLDWGKKWLADFNAGKTQRISFDRSNSTGSIDVFPRKTSVAEFYLSDSRSPVCHLLSYRKLTPSQMFLVTVCRTFKIYVRTSVMKPFFLKEACEISANCNSVENSITNFFSKAALGALRALVTFEKKLF